MRRNFEEYFVPQRVERIENPGFGGKLEQRRGSSRKFRWIKKTDVLPKQDFSNFYISYDRSNQRYSLPYQNMQVLSEKEQRDIDAGTFFINSFYEVLNSKLTNIGFFFDVDSAVIFDGNRFEGRDEIERVLQNDKRIQMSIFQLEDYRIVTQSWWVSVWAVVNMKTRGDTEIWRQSYHSFVLRRNPLDDRYYHVHFCDLAVAWG